MYLPLTSAVAGHANLLDSLMIHLADAEAEQERWYANTVRGHESESEWAESEGYGSLAADYESDEDSSESEYDSDEAGGEDGEDEDEQKVLHSVYARARGSRYLARHETIVEEDEEDEGGDEEPAAAEAAEAMEEAMEEAAQQQARRETVMAVAEEDEDDDGMFALTRTPSHRPPSLCSDVSDDDDDDDDDDDPAARTPPSSPPQPDHRVPLSPKGLHAGPHGYYHPQHHRLPAIHDPTGYHQHQLPPIVGPIY